MTDIVLRLKDHYAAKDTDAWMDCIEAAAEIEKLREALWSVMNDLTLIEKNHWLPVGMLDDVVYVNARAALEGL